jgi:hypothetical protein
MSIQPAATFDSNSDLFEIGLMAATSPEFAEAMIRALLAAAENSKTLSLTGDASSTQTAACAADHRCGSR